jgi:RNA polymerase sigma factor (sigma-70 family)
LSQEFVQGKAGELSDVVAELVSRHGSKWFKHVMRIVGNPDDAEDVLQESVRRVLERRLPLQSETAVRMYLARTITNRAIELYHLRRREQKRRLPLEDCAKTHLGHSAHCVLEEREHSAERERLLDLVHEGLARLPPKQYEALRLTVLERPRTSLRDAGLEQGIPYSTLRHRSVQAVRNVQKFVRRALRNR